MFKIGDIVKHTTSKLFGFKKGKIYIINDLMLKDKEVSQRQSKIHKNIKE